MKNVIFIMSIAMLFLSSCNKEIIKEDSNIISGKETSSTHKDYIEYTIPKGKQYCDKSSFEAVTTSKVSFRVKFDSSAIYQTTTAANQADINKLYGFSDNRATHHEFSARFGWRWSDNALRLFAYVYNKKIMSYKEIGTVQIGAENLCSIAISGNNYIFSLNGYEIKMPRSSGTRLAEGYKLFPYFGGDETAPHAISIWIQELPDFNR